MPLSIAEFFDRLRESEVLPASDVDALWKRIPKDKRDGAAERLTPKLVESGTLTQYQAAAILEGQGQILVLGDYVIQQKIGAGGMGQVFKAVHRRMKRTVAIKILPAAVTNNPDSIKRFQREVEAAARLTHPNIVAAHDAGEQKGIHYLVIEYVAGDDLANVVKKYGPLSVDLALSYISQAANGLAHAHKQGVIHRDIKPANLLVDPEGIVKILDMGLARVDRQFVDDSVEDLTKTGSFMGTVDFISPEQALDTKSADSRSDVYSLGCTLFYLLTGKPMYVGDTVMKRLVGHRDEPIPSLAAFRRDLQPGLSTVFEKMVAKRPGDRFQSMDDVREAMQACHEARINELVVPDHLTAVGSAGALPSEFGKRAVAERHTITPPPAPKGEPPILTSQANLDIHTASGRTKVGGMLEADNGFSLGQVIKSSASHSKRLAGNLNPRSRVLLVGGLALVMAFVLVVGLFFSGNSLARRQPNLAAKKVVEGNKFFAKKDWETAIACYSDAIRLDPHFVEAYIQRGKAYHETWPPDESKQIADYTEAIRLRPEDPRTYYLRGLTHYTIVDAEHRTKALADFTEAIRINPEYVEAYRYRAQVYVDQGNRARAVADSCEAVQLRPDDAANYYYRGLLYLKLGEYQKAVVDYSNAIRLEPQGRDHLLRRAEAYVALHQFELALADYDKLIGIDPNNEYLYRVRSEAFALNGDLARAAADREKAKRLANSAN